MSGKDFWNRDESEDEELDEVEAEEASDSDSGPASDSAPAPPPARIDEGAGGKGGAYVLDGQGNRIRVSGTSSDGAKDLNKASNAGPFAGRKHRERP